MGSQFPGMNPFIEAQEWEDFHTRFNTAIAEALAPQLQPRYVVRVERRIYVETVPLNEDRWLQSDAAIVLTDAGAVAAAEPTTSIAPVECLVPTVEEHRETYLVIRHVESQAVVTILETLSPSNKRLGNKGRRKYLRKRQAILDSTSHLVEIDLLRGGARMPASRVPPGDYRVLVSRSWRRPKAEIYAWSLPTPLPEIRVPLKRKDGDVPLNLQSVLSIVCQRANYDLTLNYRTPLDPPFSEVDAAWVRKCVETAKTAR